MMMIVKKRTNKKSKQARKKAEEIAMNVVLSVE